ncbi:MAG: glycine--tRNA ligase [Planctomycetota bacterium]|nr:glycine--tRNA ligase [Planctomycetota bacterium]
MPQPNEQTPAKSMDSIMSLCKRRGFIYQASEIYGGINGFWDYGPLGTMLKRNLREAWWQDVVMLPCWGRKGPTGEPVVNLPLDTCIIQNPRVWEASGHVAGFNDPMVDCKEMKIRYRADHLFVLTGVGKKLDNPMYAFIPGDTTEEKAFKQFAKYFKTEYPVPPEQCEVIPLSKVEHSEFHRLYAPHAKARGTLTLPRQFNLMFHSYTGATATEEDKVYLRPETAQGIFVQFKNVVDTNRVKLPFGIAQTGKAFRNEVTPRNFTFRSREFEQMEIEFFCHESEALDWYAFWRDWRMEWWKSLGLAGDNLILREHEKDELAHYSKATSDIEYRFPFTAPGFGELEGVAYRGNFDLSQHQQHSGVKLEYHDTTRGELLPNGSRRGERYLPHVIEPSAGLDRGVLAVLCEAYTRDDSRPSPEFMKFHPRLAPIKAAVFPLVDKDGMPEVAEKLHADLRARFGRTGLIETDAKQSIGKRYARMDEAGCPFCFTIDGDTLKDQTVTLRDRDTGQQQRIAIDRVVERLQEALQ